MLYASISKSLDSSSSRRLLAALLLVLISFRLTTAQDTFVAIPAAAAPQYHIDFARNFFASPEAEKADRANLYVTLKELETLKGRLGVSADNLERALELSDRVQIQFNRHY